jgi:hypothetical protein
VLASKQNRLCDYEGEQNSQSYRRFGPPACGCKCNDADKSCQHQHTEGSVSRKPDAHQEVYVRFGSMADYSSALKSDRRLNANHRQNVRFRSNAETFGRLGNIFATTEREPRHAEKQRNEKPTLGHRLSLRLAE